MINLNLPLRVCQLAIAITVVGLEAFVTSWYKTHTNLSVFPQSPVLLMAVGVVTICTMPYLMFNAPLQITHANRASNPKYFNKGVVLALDAITCILWFAGWINLAHFRSHLVLCAGNVCQFMTAGAALGGVAWLTYLATTTLAALHVLRTRGGSARDAAQPENHDAWVGMQQKS